MSNVVTFMRGPVTSIERQEPKTPESKARIDAMAKDCIVNLSRPYLMADLQGSISILNARTPKERAEREEQFRLLKIQQGKELITNGLALIRDNESADAAIQHLREVLMAVDLPENSGTEF
jgi:hypothetical protein